MLQKNEPVINVITVVYNDKGGIRKTLDSVASQTYSQINHIVIDGGSSDGTAGVIKEFEPQLHYWHSKPDRGLYDAMNTGISIASEGYCYFLNSGDVFDSPATISESAERMDDPDALYVGICTIHSRFGSWTNPGSPRHVRRILNRQEHPHHQSLFYPVAFLKKYGFDIRYRYIADVVLNTFAINVLEIHYLPIMIAHSELGGISTGAQSWKQIRRYVSDEIIYASELATLTWLKRVKIESKYFFKYVLSNIDQGAGLHWLMDVKHRILNG